MVLKIIFKMMLSRQKLFQYDITHMGEKKQIATFWGDNALYFIEANQSSASNGFHVPFDHKRTSADENQVLTSDNMELCSRVQNAFHQNNIQNAIVNLSLPIKDIIFRSFMIPMMQSNEVAGVIAFEVKKYIPFSLDELSYSFHPVVVDGANDKRIRIIFVAIKKNSLEKYIDILEQASLNVDVIEPAPLSLIRLLVHKNILSSQKALALVEKEDMTGKIIIVENNIPQFVREFHLRSAADSQDPDEDQTINRLINEIRISLDYFNRHENQISIEQMYLLTDQYGTRISEQIKDELEVDVVLVDKAQLMEGIPGHDSGFLKAYGASLAGVITMPASFNLSGGKPRSISLDKNSINVKALVASLLKVSICCVLVLGLAFYAKVKIVSGTKQEMIAFTQKLDMNKDSLKEKLEQHNITLQNRFDNIKSIRSHSQVGFFLDTIPTFLLDGMWIKSLEIYYPPAILNSTGGAPQDAGPVINLSGYAYVDDKKEQFSIITLFLKSLKSNKDLKKYFNEIDLETVTAQKFNEYDVTFFKIKFRKKL